MRGLGLVLAKTGLALAWFMVVTLYLTWLERKQSAVMQDRVGANRARVLGLRLFGLFQPFADAVKMIFKGDFSPRFGRRGLHALAPALTFFFISVTVIAIPFGPDIRLGPSRVSLQVIDADVGLLFILAMLALGVYGVILAGWASNNRFALLGGVRAAAQVISYEAALGLSLVGLILVFPSLRLSEIVAYQGGLLLGFLPRWGVFLQPLGFLLFFVAALAETKRVPFDMPEGESEIIGFFTEYGGMKFGLFMFADFMELLIVSCLLATLFFGGWQVPWLGDGGFVFPWGGTWPWPAWLVAAARIASFQIKVAFFCWLQVLLRWTYPRLRYDQLMSLGWKGLIPLGLLNIVVTALIAAGR
jgi:NADH-quinone oxidoreductase subunit H